MPSHPHEQAVHSLPIEFNYALNTQSLHVEMVNQEPLFLAKDVCDALELENVTKALYSLDDDEKLTLPVVRAGQTREMNFVTESGLYNLIFQSRKPEAKKFRKWVTGVVLPAIRKTGGYSKPPAAKESFLSSPQAFSHLLQYCTQQQHNGITYYAATELQKKVLGKIRSSVHSHFSKWANTGHAVRLGEGNDIKWYVRKDVIVRMLNLKADSLTAISIIKMLEEKEVTHD